MSQDVFRSAEAAALHVRQIRGHAVSYLREFEERLLRLRHRVEQMDANLRGHRNDGGATARVRSPDVDGRGEANYLRFWRTSTNSFE